MYVNNVNNLVINVILTVIVKNVLMDGICYRVSVIKGIVLFITIKLLLTKVGIACYVIINVGSVIVYHQTVHHV